MQHTRVVKKGLREANEVPMDTAMIKINYHIDLHDSIDMS